MNTSIPSHFITNIDPMKLLVLASALADITPDTHPFKQNPYPFLQEHLGSFDRRLGREIESIEEAPGWICWPPYLFTIFTADSKTIDTLHHFHDFHKPLWQSPRPSAYPLFGDI